MELITIAKPYVSAIIPITEEDNSQAKWEELLSAGAKLANNEIVKDFIAYPGLTKIDKINVVIGLLESILTRKLQTKENNFVKLLLINERINIIPSMLSLFKSMIGLKDNSKVFNVFSAYELSAEEKEKITNNLTIKYNKDVSIRVHIDQSLIGGIVVKDNDKVVDMSIKAKIENLNSCIATY
jgi:F-type H+-transporting ATPase subunit delta